MMKRVKAWNIYGRTATGRTSDITHGTNLRLACADLADGIIILLSLGFLSPDFAVMCCYKDLKRSVERSKDEQET